MSGESSERPSADERRGTDAPTTAVAVTDLQRGFGAVEVLEGVSLSVSSGSLVAVVGPNGSGKTTLLRVVAGVLEPEGGTVEVAPGGVRPVGYLPQRPSFRPGFTVADTLRFYAGLLGPTAASAVDVEALLDRVGLADAADRRVEALSGGMTRLLGIAQALLGDPPVLVLDEPGSGLDPAMRTRIFETLGGLASEGRAVLVASHDLAAVERAADRVALLDRGDVVLEGAPADLVGESDGPDLVAAFLEAVGTGTTVRTAAGADEGATGGERE